MEDAELVTLLQNEERDAAGFWQNDLAKAQADAMDRYLANPTGTEQEGRSTVVTRDVQDAINWLMPDLMRIFQASDELVTLIAESPEDEAVVDDAAEYLNHIYFEDNPGFFLTHDFLFDGLLQRLGVAEVGWKDPAPGLKKRYEGLTQAQLMNFTQSGRYEILGYEMVPPDAQPMPAQGQQPQMMPPQMQGGPMPDPQMQGQPGMPMPQQMMGQAPPPEMLFNLEVRKKAKSGRATVEVVPPEEYGYSRRSMSSDDADYQYRRQAVFEAELIRQFPEKKTEIETAGNDVGTRALDGDQRYAARYGTTSFNSGFEDRTKGARKLWLLKENLRLDYDEDGYVEIRRIWRVGNTILQNEAIEESDFATWSPIRIPHRLAGLSIDDQTGHIQRINTELVRRGLDSIDRSTFPTTFVNEMAISAEHGTMGSLLANEDVVIVRGSPDDVVQFRTVPDVSTPALQGVAFFQNMAQRSTGVGQEVQALDPKAIAKAQSGVAVDLVQTAAAARKEMIARMAGFGLEGIFRRILKVVCQHQDRPRQLMISGKPMEFDPARWSDEMAVRVHVGMGTSNRQTQIQNLTMIAGKQELIIQTAGPDNPLVPIKNYRDTLAELVRAMGYRNVTRFFAEIPEADPNAPPKETPPDPKLVEVQMKARLDQQKAQTDAQLAETKAQSASHLDEQKMHTELILKREQLTQELMLKREQLTAELELKREQMRAEIELQREAMKAKAAMAPHAGLNGSTSVSSGVRMGGEPG